MTPRIQLIDSSKIPSPLASVFGDFLPKDHAWIFCATEKENYVGIASVYIYKSIKEALIFSFHIPKGQDRDAIATSLMIYLIRYLKKMEIKILNFQYSPDPELDLVLQKTGWESPIPLMKRYFFNWNHFNPDWYRSSLPKLPKHFTLFLWKEATKSEIDLAKKWEQTNPQISQYSPFNSQYPIDFYTSLGLRQKNQLVGWMINHRISSSLLRYTALYVSPEIRGLSVGICLLKESIRLHEKFFNESEGVIEINFKESPYSWIRFVLNRLAPYATRIEELKYAYHFLKN